MDFFDYIYVFCIIGTILLFRYLKNNVRKDYSKYLKKGGSLSFKEFREKYYNVED
jgi:oligoendopeptidase F